MTRVTEFQEKDVVNVADGKKLGNIGDILVNLNTGKIESIVIAKSSRVLGFFGKDEEIVITWNNIVKIGEDVILVRYQQSYVEEEKKEEITY
ncbi:MAG: YlmC/YmxH family sporulation protein [Bacillaceae bacterium]